jgi:intracellular sulfur oxidation DsrE/DsrF family protein
MAAFLEQATTHRRSFLGRLTAGTLAMAGLAAGTARSLEAEPHMESGAGADAWLVGVTGTHRQFFDAVSVNEGFPFSFAMTFMNTIGETYHAPDKDINAIVGLRHFAIPLAFNDDIWAKYKLGEMFKVNDPVTKAPATRNPYAYAKPGELLFPGMAYEKLQERGVRFTCCNVALTVLSGMAAGHAGVAKEGAKEEWLAGMFKGVTVVPSGVLAVNRAQKKGCTYCYAG